MPKAEEIVVRRRTPEAAAMIEEISRTATIAARLNSLTFDDAADKADRDLVYRVNPTVEAEPRE